MEPSALAAMCRREWPRLDGTEILVQSQDRAPELGDSSVRFELVATATEADGTGETKLYFDAVAVRVGRGVTGLSFQSSNVPVPDLDQVAAAATKKLEKAL